MNSVKKLITISFAIISLASMQTACMDLDLAALEQNKRMPLADAKKFLEKTHQRTFRMREINADQSQNTQLMNAALMGNQQLVQAELTAHQGDKAYINQKDPIGGNTALHMAATFNRIEITKLLVAAGADLTILNNKQKTAEQLAGQDSQYVDCVQYLEQERKKQEEKAKKEKKAAKKRNEKARKREKLKQEESEESKKKAELDQNQDGDNAQPQSQVQNPSTRAVAAELQTPVLGEKEAEKPQDLSIEIPQHQADEGLVDKPSPRELDVASQQPIYQASMVETVDAKTSKESETQGLKVDERRNSQIHIFQELFNRIDTKNDDIDALLDITGVNVPVIDAQEKMVTLLQFATFYGTPQALRKILDRKPNYYPIPVDTKPVLVAAAIRGNVEIGQLLLQYYPDIIRDAKMAVEEACHAGNFDFVEMLIKSNADLEGKTIVHCAAFYGNLEAVKKYVTPLNINVVDLKNATALDYAACNNKWDIVTYLMEHGAQSNQTKLKAAQSIGQMRNILLAEKQKSLVPSNKKNREPIQIAKIDYAAAKINNQTGNEKLVAQRTKDADMKASAAANPPALKLRKTGAITDRMADRQKEADEFRAKKLQQKVVKYWKQKVAYKKNKRQILESLKPTKQELATIFRSVTKFELINARHKLATCEMELTKLFTPEAQKIDQAIWKKQWDELGAKIQSLQDQIHSMQDALKNLEKIA